MYFTKFQVMGTSNFPLDMLRYDACFPDGQDDVSHIIHANSWHVHEDREACTITLTRYHETKTGFYPTDARWRSFGWQVTKVEKPIKIL